ncbi:MAG TPA: glycosyltransferase [Actinomycetota bacterium]|nr:glycosyltransferase [Actinomycetota bacterium]
MTGVRLSVVIPAFNAAPLMASTLGDLREQLASALGPAFEIVVVDDGSVDGTGTRAKEAGADLVHRLERNRGKGAAVRAGMSCSRGDSVIFTDADLAYGPDQVLRVLDALEAGAQFAIGSRALPESDVVVPPAASRRLSTRLFNAAVRLALWHSYADTQCGLKGFRADVAAQLVGLTRIDGFAFDVELLHLAERLGMKVVEVPVSLSSTTTSSVRLALHAPQMLRDLVRIRLYEMRGAYGPRTP